MLARGHLFVLFSGVVDAFYVIFAKMKLNKNYLIFKTSRAKITEQECLLFSPSVIFYFFTESLNIANKLTKISMNALQKGMLILVTRQHRIIIHP